MRSQVKRSRKTRKRGSAPNNTRNSIGNPDLWKEQGRRNRGATLMLVRSMYGRTRKSRKTKWRGIPVGGIIE